MSIGWLLGLVCVPFLLAVLLAVPGRVGRVALRAAPWAALPVLAAALLGARGDELELPWLLIDARFRLDAIGHTFLLVAAALWSAAGVYASGYVRRGRRRFHFFFLLTMTGNLTLPLAGDAATFYVFFALMTFAGYGLIVHDGGEAAARAGRIYLILAVIGEVFLLFGLLLAVDAAGGAGLTQMAAGLASSERAALVTACLFIGFGIKAGAVPLHVWLPLAHPVAPTPASAVLSGSMIKAGLLGWLRFLPLGEAALPGWGMIILTLGMIAALFGVAVGLLQRDPKTVLAYSSVSQMGLMNALVGLALAVPGAAAPAVAAITLYAAHHGLAKGSLFLAVGVAARAPRRSSWRWVAAGGAVLGAIALTGAPLTSGSIAKSRLKEVAALAPTPWDGRLAWFLPVAAGATTLLMLRFLQTLRRAEEEKPPASAAMWAPWLSLVAMVALFPLLAGRLDPSGSSAKALTWSSAVDDLLPVVVAASIFIIVRATWRARAPGRALPTVAAGDILGPIERLIAALPSPIRLLDRIAERGLVAGAARAWYRLYAESGRGDRVLQVELGLTRWAVAVGLLLVLTVIFLGLLLMGGR